MAVNFNGTTGDHVDMGNGSSLNIATNGPISMCAWVSVPTLTPAAGGTLMGKGFTTTTAYTIGVDNNINGIFWGSFDGTNTRGYQTGALGGSFGPIPYSTLGWSINQFHHVYGEHDGVTTWRIAFDGGFFGTNVTDTGVYSNAAPFKLGLVDANGTNVQPAAGCLADVAVFSGPLTATEVANLGNGTLRPKTGMSKTLLGYWKLDTTVATQLDLSGNGNNGATTGTTTCGNSPPFSSSLPLGEATLSAVGRRVTAVGY